MIPSPDWQDFRGAARRITDDDLPRIGYTIGVGEDEIHAFIDVEAAGSGFDREGRPKILFEPHVFFRNLSGDKRARAVREGLAYPKWGEKPYPRDSYPRLAQAIQIDETAALKATSWGLAQVLGENFADAGFDTPQAMVRAFMEDEAAHLEAAVAFIRANHLDDDLRAHRWAAFARGYNGAGYRRNRYDEKLAAAYTKWAKIRDTPWTPQEARAAEDIPPIPTPAPRPTSGMVQQGETIFVPRDGSSTPPAPIGHNGGPPLVAPEPVTKPNLTPIEQMNKPVQGAKAGLGASTFGGAVVLLLASAGWLPEAWQSGEAAIALGLVAGTICGQIGSFVGAYMARDKRFQAPA